uniref:RING-type E3 ubiquitin transferase n=1 Tax=Salix viminalis TaxID=40686 RepID=A0A6N2LD41_SALVM
MAKTGVFESDPMVMTKATELKKELQRLVRNIVDDEDYRTETIDQARETLFALKELKMKRRSLSLKLRETVLCPEEFKCPLSKELMRDPVVLSTGQTYDRPFIQKWLKAGNRTCPLTQQGNDIAVVRESGLELPDLAQHVNEEGITEADRDHFLSLLEKLSLTLPEQKDAARELRLLTKKMPSFRALFGESLEAIPQLLRPLSELKSRSSIYPDLQEDIITTLLNLSIHDSNKKLVAETPMVIPLLMEALMSGTIETRTNAAAALFTLSALDSNKTLIGKSEEGHPLAMKDVASAVFNLCIIHENKGRAVRDGAVKVIMTKIMNGTHVDELLAILAVLASHQKVVDELGDLGAVPCLLRIIRENTCDRNKENCIAILHTICLNDRTKRRAMREEESAYGTISKLARNGTSRAKRKANGILERLNRAVNLTHTA